MAILGEMAIMVEMAIMRDMAIMVEMSIMRDMAILGDMPGNLHLHELPRAS